MPSISYGIKFENYTSEEGLIISPSELLEQFFHGINLCAEDGRVMSYETMRQKIASAQSEIESFLDIKLLPTVVEMTHDFIKAEWAQWGYVRVSFPVRKVCSMSGSLGRVQQIIYPTDWTSIRQSTDEKKLYRNIHLVPTGSNTAASVNTIVAVGISPHAGFLGVDSVPNYWTIKYLTGFIKTPREIYNAIAKIAAIQIFAILGDIVIGAGIASQSLGYDGLSESISTTSSAENSAYSSRIRQYAGELKTDLASMKNFYKGLTFYSV